MYELEMLSHLESSSWCEKFICGWLINYLLVTKWRTHDSFSRKVTTWKIIMMMMLKLWSPWKNNDNNNDDSIDNDQSLMVLIDDNSDSSRKSLWRKVWTIKSFLSASLVNTACAHRSCHHRHLHHPSHPPHHHYYCHRRNLILQTKRKSWKSAEKAPKLWVNHN